MRPTLGIAEITGLPRMGHLTILQRCLVLSLVAHGLLVLLMSGVVVTRQIVRYVQHSAPMVPLVNLQLSREMEVRTQTRQQLVPLPMPEPSVIHAAEPMVHTSTPEAPLAVAPGLPAAEPGKMAISLPSVAPTLTLPAPSDIPSISLAPVAPDIGPVVVTPLTPTREGKSPMETGATEGLINAQLADATPVPFGGAPGAVAAPPAVAAVGSGDMRGGPGTGLGGTPGPFNAAGPIPPTPPAPPPQAIATLPPPVAPTIATPSDGLPQRAFDERQKLLQRHGGSDKTEAAVARGLAFMARTQEIDGHWTKFDTADQAGIGQTTAHDTGLTGLAALAFLAADYSPTTPGIYQESVRKAIAWLRLVAKPDGDLRNGGSMYDQAIGTLALAESAAMTHDPRTREIALQAAQFILAAQNHDGGWRYSPRDLTSDVSVLGWQVMALRSAQRLGLDLPESTKNDALDNIRSKSTGRAGMLTGYLTALPTSTMTAEGLYSRLLLNALLSDDQLEEAGGYLLQKLPDPTKPNFYYWYYGSLALLQLSTPAPDVWKTWNAHMSESLLALQLVAGPLAGSWSSDGQWGDRGGRIYTTALGTLTLEVYYRYPVTRTR